MGLESSFSYPTDLNSSWPNGEEGIRQGDDHIRGLKAVLKTTFPNLSGPVIPTHTALNGLPDRVTGLEAKKILKPYPELDGNGLNAKNNYIYNVPDAFSEQDVVNFRQLKWYAAQIAYPVGCIYISATDTNPAATLGVGTWAAFGQGRALVGVGTGTDSNSYSQSFTALGTTGEYVHTLTTTELPAHTHQIGSNGHDGNPDSGTNSDDPRSYGSGNGPNLTTSSVGSSAAHNNVQPSIGVYMWRRTA